LEARSELIETRQRQMSAMVDLYRALGGGWQPASN
jgi:outer membrane protein TolC